ncbi:MAG: hypothetical protein K2N88_02605 [Muribaculaceae bacterium]|nr:hypothetical protein [Muribaculaceae bacterium]
MTKEQQDLAWACLPKETRDEIKFYYQHCSCGSEMESMLEDLFGSHNLTSNTEPEEMLRVERKKVQQLHEEYKNLITPTTCPVDKAAYGGVLLALQTLFGDKCLPDKELNEDNFAKSELEHRLEQTVQASVQVKPGPKFSKGEIVRVTSYDKLGVVGRIIKVDEEDDGFMYTLEGVVDWRFAEKNLEPYTEENKGTMEEKELNLIEILKDCPKGEMFFSLIAGNVTFQGVDSHWEQEVWKPIRCTGGDYNSDGTYTDPSDKGVCCLYPSRTLYEKYPLDPYSAWMEWKEARKTKRWRAKLGEKYWVVDIELSPTWSEEKNDGYDKVRYNNGNYFRTEEEAKQAAEAVRETLEKFHEKSCE